jgi:hypothetical protein
MQFASMQPQKTEVIYIVDCCQGYKKSRMKIDPKGSNITREAGGRSWWRVKQEERGGCKWRERGRFG